MNQNLSKMKFVPDIATAISIIDRPPEGV